MSKLNIEELAKGIPQGTPPIPGMESFSGGDGIMENIQAVISGIRSAIQSYKEALLLEKEVRGGNSPGGIQQGGSLPMAMETNPKTTPAPPPPPPPLHPGEAILLFLNSLVGQGYGEKTIGDMVKVLSPFTINQAKEYIENVIKPGK